MHDPNLSLFHSALNNAKQFIQDAQILLDQGSTGHSYGLSVLAFEEFVKLVADKKPFEYSNTSGGLTNKTSDQQIITTQSSGSEGEVENVNQKIIELTREEEEKSKREIEDLSF